MKFSPQREERFQDYIQRYPKKEAALLPVLWLAQEEFEVLTTEVQKFVADKLDLSLARVQGVVSFYTMYNTKKKGKYHLQVCKNISCVLRGCKEVMNTIESELQIAPGETTSDEMFHYSTVECLGACGNAPAMQINVDKYYENLTIEETKSILQSLKEKA